MQMIDPMKGLAVIVVIFSCLVYDISYNNGETVHWIGSMLGLS
jgi:hypothetical protein